MGEFLVPLVIRGQVINAAEVEYGGRRSNAPFKAPDLASRADMLPLRSPALLADLYELGIDDIADFLENLGGRLHFKSNPYLQEAFELSRLTSGLTEDVLRRTYEIAHQNFTRAFVREYAESAIGIPYLEGWVTRRLGNGARASIRAFGARAVHIVAGNSPLVSVNTVIRNSITRSDMIVKTPSNDPLTAAAVARTMVDMAPDHPITRHISVAYWKGGDAAVEDSLYQPRNIEKIVAWGGLASITHIQKYIQPGIDLITLDPKLSSTIIGREAFASRAAMEDVAERLAVDIGSLNQEACLNARVVYVESGTDEPGLKRANELGAMVFEEIQKLPRHLSGPTPHMDTELAEEIDALRLSSNEHKIIGGGSAGAVIVSQVSEPVDFSRLLANRVANLVPVDDLELPVRSTNAYTQTIGVYPDALKAKLRDRLAFHGAQRIVSLGYAPRLASAGPHDGIEPLRRMCKWIIEEEYDPAETPLASRAG